MPFIPHIWTPRTTVVFSAGSTEGAAFSMFNLQTLFD